MTSKASSAINEAETLGLLDGFADEMLSNSKIPKLSSRRQEPTIILSAVPHMLDHQEFDETFRIDAERSPRRANEQ
jgi:hypothetical protein